MSSFTRLNKVVATFKNANKDLPFKKINEVEKGVTYKVNGIFSTNGKFGKSFFVSLTTLDNKEFFNFGLPHNQNDNAQAILDNSEYITAINEGTCGIILSSYFSKKFNRECVAVEWCDIMPF